MRRRGRPSTFPSRHASPLTPLTPLLRSMRAISAASSCIPGGLSRLPSRSPTRAILNAQEASCCSLLNQVHPFFQVGCRCRFLEEEGRVARGAAQEFAGPRARRTRAPASAHSPSPSAPSPLLPRLARSLARASLGCLCMLAHVFKYTYLCTSIHMSINASMHVRMHVSMDTCAHKSCACPHP